MRGRSDEASDVAACLKGRGIITEAGKPALFRGADSLACERGVWECVSAADIRDVRGHGSISNLTDRHAALTRCLSARGPVWETEREGGGGGILIPHSSIWSKSLRQENLGEEEENNGAGGGHGHMLLTLSYIDRAHSSETRENPPPSSNSH